MLFIELQTELTQEQWDKIVYHSEAERAVLLAIIEFSLANMYAHNFAEKLEAYAANKLTDISEKNAELEMLLPMYSIESTVKSLVSSIKKSRTVAIFLKTVKYTITHHTKFTYKGSISISEKTVQIPEVNFQFNVKYNLVGNRSIDNVTFCYAKKLATFACIDR